MQKWEAWLFGSVLSIVSSYLESILTREDFARILSHTPSPLGVIHLQIENHGESDTTARVQGFVFLLGFIFYKRTKFIVISVENRVWWRYYTLCSLSAFLLFELSSLLKWLALWRSLLSFTPSGDNLAESVAACFIPKVNTTISPPRANPPKRTKFIWT